MQLNSLPPSPFSRSYHLFGKLPTLCIGLVCGCMLQMPVHAALNYQVEAQADATENSNSYYSTHTTYYSDGGKAEQLHQPEPFVPMPSVLEADSSHTSNRASNAARATNSSNQPVQFATATDQPAYTQPAIEFAPSQPVSNKNIAALLDKQDLGVWNPYKNTIIAGYMEFRANLQNAMNNDPDLKNSMAPMTETDFETWYISQFQTLAMAFAGNNVPAAKKIINGIQVNSPNTLASVLQQVQRDYDALKQNYQLLTSEGQQLKQEVVELDKRITEYQQKVNTSYHSPSIQAQRQKLNEMSNLLDGFKAAK